MFVAVTVESCRRPGLLGVVFSYADEAAAFLWFAQSGAAFVLRDVYLLYATLLFYLEYAANFSFRHYFAYSGGPCAAAVRERRASLHGGGGDDDDDTIPSLFSAPLLTQRHAKGTTETFTMPSFEAQLLFSFLAFWTTHALLWRHPIRRGHVAWACFYLLFVLLGLAYNAAADSRDLVAGAVLGTLSGFGKAYFFKFYLYPYLPFLLRRTLLGRLGYVDFVIREWTLRRSRAI
jgi:hypothetical protein